MAHLRRIAALFVLAFLSLQAQAQTAYGPTSPTIGDAWALCLAEKPSNFGFGGTYDSRNSCNDRHPTYVDPFVYGPGIVGCKATGTDLCSHSKLYRFTAGCAAGSTWSNTQGRCVTAEEISTCAAQPQFSGLAEGSAGGGNVCKDGCSFYLADGESGTNAAGKTAKWGTFAPAGAVCTPAANETVAVRPPTLSETCIAIGALSQCRQSDGKMCAVTPRGNKACWTPGETGTKVAQDQKEALSKTVSPTVAAAPTSLVNAQTVSSTSTTQTAPGATPTNVVNNITYANVTGQAGTGTAGSDSPGTATGTTPGTTPSTGDSEAGEPGTSTGGADCAAPPVSTGDGVLVQIAFQAWKTRCAVAGLTEGTVSFGDVETGAAGSDGTTVAADAFGEVDPPAGLENGFDDAGFLSAPRECPDLPTLVMPLDGGEIDLDEKFQNFCELMRIGGLFVLLFGALASIKIYSRVFT